jgi:hypothetical protein
VRASGRRARASSSSPSTRSVRWLSTNDATAPSSPSCGAGRGQIVMTLTAKATIVAAARTCRTVADRRVRSDRHRC